MTEPILQTESLTKRYGQRTVVDNLALQVEAGDIFGFLGQNGAGKSTVIRMMLGLVRPSAGRISLFGKDARKNSPVVLARVGAIVEAPAFYENFSARQNFASLRRCLATSIAKKIEEASAPVSLRDRANDPVRTYSHGMKQRLGIANALLPNPEFVILDEPTDGLDPQGIQDVRSLLPRLRDERELTIMLSSHLLFEVETTLQSRRHH